ncbi:MAG TPA: nucleotidyltransferase domain-containing protein [Anaerolineales bacterium]|nr:nucleotidyltransferase domain-containing protein [Anaerolineales bacterium]
MQNTHVQRRIDFARQLANSILAFDGIQAIVIAGSVARGYADAYSDIEIPIFWETLPDDATRHAIVSALHAEFLYAYDGPACEDQLLIDGLQVDLWHVTVAHQEATMDAVLRGHNLEFGGLNALDTIRFCIPLYGDEIVQIWKRRAQEYPDELAEKIVQEHLGSFSISSLFILAQRENPTGFYAQLSFLQQEIFLVLLALNRKYFPTFKWLYPVLESMQVKPEDMDRRFRQAYKVSYAEATANTKLLLEETLHLVEGQFPQLDTATVHRRLGYVRVKHSGQATAHDEEVQ